MVRLNGQTRTEICTFEKYSGKLNFYIKKKKNKSQNYRKIRLNEIPHNNLIIINMNTGRE